MVVKVTAFNNSVTFAAELGFPAPSMVNAMFSNVDPCVCCYLKNFKAVLVWPFFFLCAAS